MYIIYTHRIVTSYSYIYMCVCVAIRWAILQPTPIPILNLPHLLNLKADSQTSGGLDDVQYQHPTEGRDSEKCFL